MNKIVVVILLNFLSGILCFLSSRVRANWLLWGTLVFSFLSVGFLGKEFQKSEAKKRELTNPITSFDQLGMAFVALLVIGFVFFCGFAIAYTLFR